MRVHGEDAYPPTPTILNTGQFMTKEEMTGGVGEPQWFVAYSHALQWIGKATQGPCTARGKWPHSPCHYFPGQVGSLDPQFRCLGPIYLATQGGSTMGPHRSGAVWLLLWSGSRPQPHDAGSTILGHGGEGSLPLCCKRPGV